MSAALYNIDNEAEFIYADRLIGAGDDSSKFQIVAYLPEGDFVIVQGEHVQHIQVWRLIPSRRLTFTLAMSVQAVESIAATGFTYRTLLEKRVEVSFISCNRIRQGPAHSSLCPHHNRTSTDRSWETPGLLR